MRLSLPGHFHWPPSIFLVIAVLFAGAILLILSIAMRRSAVSTTGSIAAELLLLIAAVWNAGIVFAFTSPHNRHVFQLATHRGSVVVNAAIGALWLSLCVFSVVKWYR